MKIITAHNVSRYFTVNENKKFSDYFKSMFTKVNKKRIEAVTNITFEVEKGEIVGLIGVNGAGKSTLIKMMTGILSPSDGELRVMGNIPFKNRNENNAKLAAVFGQRCQLRWDISTLESYGLLKKMYKVSDEDYQNRLSRLTDVLDLEPFINQPVRTLSLGQKMRAELGAAFLHAPEIVFLDEPTLGLDVFSKDAILEFILEMKKTTDTTIVLTTHDLEDINRVCEHLIIINKGKVLVDDRKENILQSSALGNTLEVEFEDTPSALPDVVVSEIYTMEENILSVYNLNDIKIASIMGTLYKDNIIKRVQVKNPEFKDVFKEMFHNENDKNKVGA